MHLGRLDMWPDALKGATGVSQDQLGLLQGPGYVQLVEVIQSVVGLMTCRGFCIVKCDL